MGWEGYEKGDEMDIVFVGHDTGGRWRLLAMATRRSSTCRGPRRSEPGRRRQRHTLEERLMFAVEEGGRG